MDSKGERPELIVSAHARVRYQQRGISGEVIDVVYRYGKAHHSGDAISYSMDKKGHEKAMRALGAKHYASLSTRLNCYVVVARDKPVLITAATRLRKHRRS